MTRRARDMLLTGRQIDAAPVLDWGLVTRVSERGRELDEATDVAKAIVRTAPSVRRVVKRATNRQYEVKRLCARRKNHDPAQDIVSIVEKRST